MKNKLASGAPVPPGVIVAVLLVILALAGFMGWKTFGGGSAASSEKVPLNVEQIKKDFQSGSGFGNR